jgi:hypothetical protein
VKVLTIVGNPVEKYGRQYREELAKVWVDDKHRIYVTPVNLAKPEFAVELQRLIDERVEKNPKTPFFVHVLIEDEQKNGDVESADGYRPVSPGDKDFLDTFMGEIGLFGWGAKPDIAGYVVHTGESEVSEE